MIDYQKAMKKLASLIGKMEAQGLEASCRLMEPAAASEIDRTETELDIKFPSALRESLLAFRCRLNWQRDEGLPDEFDFCSSGCFDWHLDSLVDVELYRRSFFNDVIGIPSNDGHRAWLNKLAILSTDEGHFIAVDLEGGDDPPVVMLTRDNTEPTGEILAPSLTQFFEQWFQLACVGPSIAAFGDITDGYNLPFNVNNGHVKTWLDWLHED